MAENKLSFKVATTLAAQRIVNPSTATADTVKYPAAASESLYGITMDTVLDTTSAIPVQINGIAKLLMNQTVASGALVAADSSGRGVAHAGVTAGSYVIGTLIGAESGTATVGRVLINPQFISIP